MERDGFPRQDTEVGERPDGFPREEDIDTTPGVWSTPPQPRRDMGGRIIPRGEAEFRRHLRDGRVRDEDDAETREEGSDETEVMETEPPGESDRGKSARAVETAEDVDVPEEPEAWDSGSERGDDMEFGPDEGAEEEWSDPGDEERLKTRGGTHDRSLRWRCRHPSVQDCAIYSRGRGWLRVAE